MPVANRGGGLLHLRLFRAFFLTNRFLSDYVVPACLKYISGKLRSFYKNFQKITLIPHFLALCIPPLLTRVICVHNDIYNWNSVIKGCPNITQELSKCWKSQVPFPIPSLNTACITFVLWLVLSIWTAPYYAYLCEIGALQLYRVYCSFPGEVGAQPLPCEVRAYSP